MLRRSISTKMVCDEYIEKLKRDGKKLSTRANYQQKIEKYILPYLPKKITKLNNFNFNGLSIQLQESLSNKSVNDIITLLNCILKFAFNFKYMRKQITIEKIKGNEADSIEVFTNAEQKILINHLSTHLNYFNFSVALALMTGIRIGELSALTIENLHDDFLEVKFTLQRVKNIDTSNTLSKTVINISSPKSQKSKRLVPIPSILKDAKERLNYSKDSFIVTGKKIYMEPRTIERNFKKLLEECHIKYRKFHTLRHTFAMNCVAINMQDTMLAELLGHSSTTTTKKYYIHYNLEMKKTELEKVPVYSSMS